MTTPITPAECRELAEMLGIKWHHIATPTISNPWLLTDETGLLLDEAIAYLEGMG